MTFDPISAYEALPLEKRQLLDEINFLAAELREHLLPEQFLLAIEALTTRLQSLHSRVPCSSGCHQCCLTTDPIISPFEAELLTEALQTLTTETRQTIQNQLDKRACPLLIQGRCSVYGARPLQCRLMGYSFKDEHLLPHSCQPEQQRIQVELMAQSDPLAYMFFPRLDRLQLQFQKLESMKKTTSLREWLAMQLP